jgi:hypothetical protein
MFKSSIEAIRAIIILLIPFLFSCIRGRNDHSPDQLFTLLDKKETKIEFINQVKYTEEFNTYTYRNFYNGAGVGIGDFNNDGLQDIYFCGNQNGNSLYINKGGFVFEDISEKAGVKCTGSWSTGVTIADINGDGWSDIYVCKSGPHEGNNRHNELFINNRNLTFSEKAAEYGLANTGLSNHASFFDYDRDGDLDCYLLNNSFHSVTGFDLIEGLRDIPDSLGSNKLFRNDDGFFTDATRESGIFSSKIGFGLGVTAGDVNRDGWIDIYVSNDFFERDYLYINNKNGTFTESLTDQMNEISLGAMGADMADMNNDSWPEIYTTEMTPEDNTRFKTKALFDNWETYRMKLDKGYHFQFARNALQLNNRNGTFSEIGRFSGVSTTDWSWGALIMDLDNDGWKDIFVANGIYKDLLDRDFLDIYSDPSIMRSMIKTEESAIIKLIEMIPSTRISNYSFRNNRDLTFTNVAGQWGLDTPSFSNGAAYADLDNDGDIDLVVNNVNMPPFIYRNNSENIIKSHFINLSLTGRAKNTAAIGANVTLYYNGLINYQELIPARGFQSCCGNSLHFGLGEHSIIDSIIVCWPDRGITKLFNVAADQFITIEATENTDVKTADSNDPGTIFKSIVKIAGLDFRHIENDFNDFERDGLLFNMLSNEGPRISKGDINGDGLDDLYICGASGNPGAFYVQLRNGTFKRTNTEITEADKISEDTDCAFFDADNDGDIDLYVASGGNEFPSSSSALMDRLYLNDGKGNFSKSDQMLPSSEYVSTSCVRPEDFDNDGDMDLFVGTRLKPFAYGLPADSYLLKNDGNGNFNNITGTNAPGLIELGMITDMAWSDINNDGYSDMIIVGEWMPVKVFLNNKGTFADESEQCGLLKTEGWWHTVEAKDLNKDGKTDFILGNHGLNSRFKVSPEKPVKMYVNDFDLNGSIEQVICTFNGEKAYPLVMKDDIVRQIPALGNKYPKFDDYKDVTIEEIFPQDVLKRSVILETGIMESCVLMNNGNLSFSLEPLPAEAQFSPVYAISADDFDRDGICDILIGGNQTRAKPETGIYSASYGLLLKGKENGSFEPVPSVTSGICIKGEIRDLQLMDMNGVMTIIVARNNDNLQFYKF